MPGPSSPQSSSLPSQYQSIPTLLEILPLCRCLYSYLPNPFEYSSLCGCNTRWCWAALHTSLPLRVRLLFSCANAVNVTTELGPTLDEPKYLETSTRQQVFLSSSSTLSWSLLVLRELWCSSFLPSSAEVHRAAHSFFPLASSQSKLPPPSAILELDFN